jgi:hypothetical protein
MLRDAVALRRRLGERTGRRHVVMRSGRRSVGITGFYVARNTRRRHMS